MSKITIVKASKTDFQEVSSLIADLLVELEPEAADEIRDMNIPAIANELLEQSKIWAYIARSDDEPVGVITLHECAAVYAGGVFGEISELYVHPDYRSRKIGDMLIEAAVEKGRQMGWKRLEVGTPPESDFPRTIRFYERKGFIKTGSRLKLPQKYLLS